MSLLSKLFAAYAGLHVAHAWWRYPGSRATVFFVAPTRLFEPVALAAAVAIGAVVIPRAINDRLVFGSKKIAKLDAMLGTGRKLEPFVQVREDERE